MDYEQLEAPLYGSVARQIHAAVLKKRRQSLGLEQTPLPMNFPGALDPKVLERRELEGGVVLVGRASLKEYMEGLRRGWEGGVNEWHWEKEVEGRLVGDGVFDPPESSEEVMKEEGVPASSDQPTVASPIPSRFTSFSRPPLSTSPPPFPSSPSPSPTIPSHLHIPPSPLPPQPPILLLPFTNHLGFRQFPLMIRDFFTERHRVRSGANAALALIESHTRPFTSSDKDFDRQAEGYYTKAFDEMSARIATARKEYYANLAPRLEAARALASGERELSDAEKKSGREAVTEESLREERRKKELRWFGNEDGREIVRRESEVRWDERWEGWLRVYDLSEHGGEDGASEI